MDSYNKVIIKLLQNHYETVNLSAQYFFKCILFCIRQQFEYHIKLHILYFIKKALHYWNALNLIRDRLDQLMLRRLLLQRQLLDRYLGL